MKTCGQCKNPVQDNQSSCTKCGSSNIVSPTSEGKKQVNERMYD